MRKMIPAAGLALSMALTGCSPDLEDRFSTWAIGSERARAHLEHKQLSVDGFNIAYLEGGQGDTVFLIHGFQSNKDIWVRLALSAQLHPALLVLPVLLGLLAMLVGWLRLRTVWRTPAWQVLRR